MAHLIRDAALSASFLSSNHEQSLTDSHVRAGATSTLGSSFNVLCTVMGTGLLQLPYGAARSGWCSIVILPVLGSMGLYSAHLVVKCIHIMKQAADNDPNYRVWEGNVPSYGEIGLATFGSFGRWMVAVQMHLTLTMVATIYNLLAGQNLQVILQAFHVNDGEVSLTMCVFVVSLVMWFHVFLKDLGDVAILSYINMSIMVIMEVVVIVTALRTPPATPATHNLIVDDLPSFGSAFASFAFAYGVHPILPTVYVDMKYPKQYTRMILIAFGTAIVLYLPMLAVGYWVYGAAAVSPIYEVPAMKDSPVVVFCIVAMTFPILGAYAIVTNAPERALEFVVGVEGWKCPFLGRVLLRSCFVVGTCTVSITLKDDFANLLALVSSLTGTFTSFIFPCMFYLKLCSMHGHKVHPIELFWNLCVILASCVGGTFGCIDAVNKIAGHASA